ELEVRLGDRARWHRASCPPYGEGVTFGPLREVVRLLIGASETDEPSRVLELLERSLEGVAQDESDRRWLLSQLAPVVAPGLEDGLADPSRDELFSATTRYLSWTAAAHPLVLVVEDVHWAEEPMRALLEHLSKFATGA